MAGSGDRGDMNVGALTLTVAVLLSALCGDAFAQHERRRGILRECLPDEDRIEEVWRRIEAPEAIEHLLALARGDGLRDRAGIGPQGRAKLIWHAAMDGRVTVCEKYYRVFMWDWVMFTGVDAGAQVLDEGHEFWLD